MTTATVTNTATPLSWDDQIVPALRRKLEAESAQLGKRISVLDSSHASTAGNVNGTTANAGTGWGPLGSDQRVSSNRDHGSYRGPAPSSSSSIYATPTRNASQKLRVAATGTGDSPTDSTQRAREKARAIRERRASVRRNDGRGAEDGSSSGTGTGAGAGAGTGALYHSSSSSHLNGDAANVTTTRHPPSSSSSGSAPPRLRTQSTPMKYVQGSPSSSSPRNQPQAPTPREKARARAEEANRRDREEMEQREWAGTSVEESATSPSSRPPRGLYDSESPDGPPTLRLPTALPSNYSTRTTRSGSIDPSAMATSSAATTPDPLYSANRNMRAATEPPEVMATNKNDDWDEVLPPAIARRVAQEELLRTDPSLRSVEGLIDTWDRQGLPLTQGQVMELVGRRRERERAEKEQEQEQEELARRQREASIAAGGHEHEQQQASTSQVEDARVSATVVPPPPVGLASLRGASRSSGTSAPQEYEMRERVEAHPQPQHAQPAQPQSAQPSAHDDGGGAGCCACVVM